MANMPSRGMTKVGFQRCKFISEAKAKCDVSIFPHCLMPNHWRFLLREHEDGRLSQFIDWLTNTHTRRYRLTNKTWGEGPLYQGRFKSFPVKDDQYGLSFMLYFERNPL